MNIVVVRPPLFIPIKSIVHDESFLFVVVHELLVIAHVPTVYLIKHEPGFSRGSKTILNIVLHGIIL